MRPASIMLALALAACSVRVPAADIEFEVDSESLAVKSETRQPIPGRMVIAPETPSYDHPLYEGLWSMTLAAFRRLDEPKDTEFPTFCIAANN